MRRWMEWWNAPIKASRGSVALMVTGLVLGIVFTSVFLGPWIDRVFPAWNNGQEVKAPIYCATEDTCTLDYRDGYWHVRRP